MARFKLIINTVFFGEVGLARMLRPDPEFAYFVCLCKNLAQRLAEHTSLLPPQGTNSLNT